MTDLITTDLVRLDADLGSDKHDVIRALAAVVDDAGRASDVDQLVEDAFAREATSATGLPGGIAIPHCRTTGVETPTLAFARLEPPVDFGAKDGPADLAFLIAAPAGGDANHLTHADQAGPRAGQAGLHRRPARGARRPRRSSTWSPTSSASPPPAQAAAGSRRRCRARRSALRAAAAGKPSLVAVTACPTGIAHTYMAAEALEAAAERAGVELHVETQGSAGSTPLAPDDHRRRPAP